MFLPVSPLAGSLKALDRVPKAACAALLQPAHAGFARRDSRFIIAIGLLYAMIAAEQILSGIL